MALTTNVLDGGIAFNEWQAISFDTDYNGDGVSGGGSEVTYLGRVGGAAVDALRDDRPFRGVCRRHSLEIYGVRLFNLPGGSRGRPVGREVRGRIEATAVSYRRPRVRYPLERYNTVTEALVYSRSKRSSRMTLLHVSTKSCTNFSSPSSAP